MCTSMRTQHLVRHTHDTVALMAGETWHFLQSISCRRSRLPLLTAALTGVCFVALAVLWCGASSGETARGVTVTVGRAGDDPAAEAELRHHWLDPPSPLPYNLSDAKDYLYVAKGDTWTFIYRYMSRLFSGETGGFFVEAGALDGQILSNTLWLERELGWRGLLVEPDAFSYSHLQAKHRKAWTSNTCLSPSGLTNTSVHVSLSLSPLFVSPWWYMKGASHELGVTMREAPTIDNYLKTGVESYSLVNCFPLATYLRALNVSTIDLLSLDTQGSELSIIKTIPWQEVRVRVVVVELIAPEFDHEFVDYMRGRGFTLVGHFNDYIFVQEGDAALARLRAQEDWYVVVKSGK